MHILATATLACASLSLLSLLVLHLVSHEFEPSWRMISEYALGKNKWLLTSFFLFWGVSSFLLAFLLWSTELSVVAHIGVILLFVSGIGEVMGGLFDIRHKLHGLSFLLGVPTLPAAALMVSYYLVSRQGWSAHPTGILLSAHATWISLVVMAISMVVMMSGFKKAGIPMGPGAEPPKTVPAGVIAVNGYCNRLLVIAYLLWLMVMASVLPF
jgi:hypothetical protein